MGDQGKIENIKLTRNQEGEVERVRGAVFWCKFFFFKSFDCILVGLDSFA